MTAGDPNIRHMTDMADAEKASIFNGAASCKLAMLSRFGRACHPSLKSITIADILPSKFHPTFVETFGIVITEAMLTECGPVITCRTGGIPEAAGDDAQHPTCVFAEVDNTDTTGAHQDCLEESLKLCLNRVVLEMTAEEKETMTSEARKYSMQFGREQVFGLLEAKATVAREAKRVTTAPNSPSATPEKGPAAPAPVSRTRRTALD